MFDWIVDAFSDIPGLWDNTFGAIGDYFSGATASRINQKYAEDAAKLAQQYNLETMAKQFSYSKQAANYNYDLSMRYIPESLTAYKNALVQNGYNPLLALSSSAPHFQGSATAPSSSSPSVQSGGAASAGSFGSAVGAISSAVGGLGNLVKLGSELGLNSALSSKALADTRLSESSAALNAAKTAEINQSLPYRLRNLQYRGELGETVNTVRNAYEEAATAVRGFGGRVADSVNSVGASSAKALKQVSDKVEKTLDEGKGFFRNLGSRYLRNMDLMRMPLR